MKSLLSATQKSKDDEMELEKAKKMPIGTVSHGRKKVAEGKWVDVPKGKAEPSKREIKGRTNRNSKYYDVDYDDGPNAGIPARGPIPIDKKVTNLYLKNVGQNTVKYFGPNAEELSQSGDPTYRVAKLISSIGYEAAKDTIPKAVFTKATRKIVAVNKLYSYSSWWKGGST
jgi:hypothetical protein